METKSAFISVLPDLLEHYITPSFSEYSSVSGLCATSGMVNPQKATIITNYIVGFAISKVMSQIDPSINNVQR